MKEKYLQEKLKSIMMLANIAIIIVGLCILGLPLSLLWFMWQDDKEIKELKKQGKLPPDW